MEIAGALLQVGNTVEVGGRIVTTGEIKDPAHYSKKGLVLAMAEAEVLLGPMPAGGRFCGGKPMAGRPIGGTAPKGCTPTIGETEAKGIPGAMGDTETIGAVVGKAGGAG